MKNTILVAALLMFSTCAFAQESVKDKEKSINAKDVPTIVKQAFQKDYPNIKKVEWNTENGFYEAEFTLNGTEASANYDKSGIKKEFEIGIKTEQLPSSVLSCIKSNYTGYKISESAKITDNKNVVTYEAEVKKGKEAFDLIFDVTGKFLKKK